MDHGGTCEVCGNPVKRSYRRTCSHKCAWVLRKLQKPTRPLMIKICPACNNEFQTRRENHQYCTIACFNRSSYRGIRSVNVPMEIACQYCGKVFRRGNGQTKIKCCSRGCSIALRFGQKQLELKVFTRGTRRKPNTKKENRSKIREAFPYCQRCGWHEEPIILHIHHKDRNHANWAIDNLESLCPNCHFMEHYRSGDWTQYFKEIHQKKISQK